MAGLPPRLVLVDDNPDDRALSGRLLRWAFEGIVLEEAGTPDQFRSALERGQFDAVLTDYHLGWSDGIAVLRAARRRDPDCGVVMVTGTGSEEVAVEAMKLGVDDYVLKGITPMRRLVPAVRACLERTAERRAARVARGRYLRLFEGVPQGLYRSTPDGRLLDGNPGLLRLLGCGSIEELRQLHLPLLLDAPERRREALERTGRVEALEARLRRPGGSPLWVEENARLVTDEGGTYVEGSLEDITIRRRARDRLASQLAVTRALAESTGLAEAAPRLLEALCTGLGWDAGQVWRVEQGAIRLRTSWPAPDDAPAELAARVLAAGCSMRDEVEGRCAALGWPVRVGPAMAAVIVLRREVPRAVEPDVADALEDIGGRLGQFLEREGAIRGLRRLQKAVEALGMGVTITDDRGRIVYTNPTEAEMHGYAAGDLIGRHVSVFMPEGWQPAPGPPPEEGGWKRETVNVHRDGTVFPVQLLSQRLIGPDDELGGMVTVCEEITQRKRGEEALRAERLRGMERLRARIASDLHDDIGASLSQVAILAEVVRQRVAADGETAELLVRIAETSRGLVDALGDIVWAVNPARDALADLVDRMHRFAVDALAARGVALRFRAHGGDRLLEAGVRRHLLLLFKEAVHNVARHAGARAARIELGVERGWLHLRVQDDGQGFDPAHASGGHGLTSMRERAAEMGGTLRIRSRVGRGTTLRLDVPVPDLGEGGRPDLPAQAGPEEGGGSIVEAERSGRKRDARG